jgi:hypothetical protein
MQSSHTAPSYGSINDDQTPQNSACCPTTKKMCVTLKEECLVPPCLLYLLQSDGFDVCIVGLTSCMIPLLCSPTKKDASVPFGACETGCGEGPNRGCVCDVCWPVRMTAGAASLLVCTPFTLFYDGAKKVNALLECNKPSGPPVQSMN